MGDCPNLQGQRAPANRVNKSHTLLAVAGDLPGAQYETHSAALKRRAQRDSRCSTVSVCCVPSGCLTHMMCMKSHAAGLLSRMDPSRASAEPLCGLNRSRPRCTASCSIIQASMAPHTVPMSSR